VQRLLAISCHHVESMACISRCCSPLIELFQRSITCVCDMLDCKSRRLRTESQEVMLAPVIAEPCCIAEVVGSIHRASSPICVSVRPWVLHSYDNSLY